MSARHMQLVDAANEAETAEQHALAMAYLRGFREGAGIDGFGLMEADMHSMAKYGEDTDMCGGVLFRSLLP